MNPDHPPPDSGQPPAATDPAAILPPPPHRFRRFRRLVARFTKSLLALALILLIARNALTPGPSPRREIAPGVFLEVLHLHQPGVATGAVMIAEIHWATPGVEIFTRPIDKTLTPAGKHHRLSLASFELVQNDLLLLLNGTLHRPAAWHDNYPGAPIQVNESVVSNGVWSHLHEHSYLIWWDAHGNGHCERQKPPPLHSQQHAVTAIGIQRIAVASGNVTYRHSEAPTTEPMDSQSFIGIDPERKILWLLAFENSTVLHAATLAAKHGVQFGGRLDSGDSTTLVVGPAASRVFPFTGIRHSRFLGNYIAVRFRNVARASRPKPPKQG